MFFCGLLHFFCDGKSYDECVCVCMCDDSPLVLGPSASCVTYVGDFLHCRSLILRLAVAQFSLFHNCMTGPPYSLAVILRSIYYICLQHSKLVSLSASLIYLTAAPLHSLLNHLKNLILSQTKHLSFICLCALKIHLLLFI